MCRALLIFFKPDTIALAVDTDAPGIVSTSASAVPISLS